MIEGGFCYRKQRVVKEVTHWLCERRGSCKAIIHTKGLEIVKRTNDHLHAPDEQAASCCEVKAGIKRKANESQDSSHQILGETLQTVSESTAAKLPRLSSLKRTIQRQRVLQYNRQNTWTAETSISRLRCVPKMRILSVSGL